MFRKKEQPVQAQSQILNGRYVKVEPNRRGAYVEYKRDYGFSPRGISETDISESYLSERDEEEINQRRQDIERLSKSSGRKIPFLQKKNRDLGGSFPPERQTVFGADLVGDDENDDEQDDISEITTYNEGVPIAYDSIKKNVLNPVDVNQAVKRLDLDQQYAEEVQIYERMNYILDNYRPPPAYPGQINMDSAGKSMIQQLLQEKANMQIKDNASMINYCRVDAPKDVSIDGRRKVARASPADSSMISPQLRVNPNPTSSPSYQSLVGAGAAAAIKPSPDVGNNLKSDKLVMRTLHSPRTPESMQQSLFNLGGIIKAKFASANDVFNMQRTTPELISEIYPRDYDPDGAGDVGSIDLNHNEKASLGNRQSSVESGSGSEAGKPFLPDSAFGTNQNYIVDVKPSYRGNENEQRDFIKPYANPPGYRQHPERDYDLSDEPDYETQVYEPDGSAAGSSHLTYIHSHEKSETYVPPSPYMYAEIPEWLQVYAKASPDLDDLLKWEMFRLPELDCWQTMLKRLYMKELEQIVFWFEEYRQSMQQEIKRREMELGIMRVPMPVLDQRMKKTDV